MNRRAIPLIGMSPYGEDSLRAEGFVAIPLTESYILDPLRALPHYHHFFQVTLLLGGGTLMHDFREAEVVGPNLLFISPGQVHTVLPTAGIGGTIISFTREFCDPASDHAAGFLMDLPFFHAGSTLPLMQLTPKNTSWAKAAFEELQGEYDHAEYGAAEVLRSLLRILLVKSTRWYAEDAPKADGSRSAILVRNFQREVELHYLEWTALEPYAKHLGVTVNHLNDQVRRVTGQSAGEHIRQRRVLDAKRLLLHSSLSVSEIGYRLGFEDPSYFSRFFRRYEELTPLEFRTRIREKYQNPAKDHRTP